MFEFEMISYHAICWCLLACLKFFNVFIVDEMVIKALKQGFHQSQRLFIGYNMGFS
jgi:hypothetical protein